MIIIIVNINNYKMRPESILVHYIARYVLLLTSACLSITTSAGDDDSLPLETVVITGTRTEQLLSQSPVRVEVIKKSDIERNHANTIADALRQVSGIQLVKPTGKEGVTAMMQGVSADRVLVMVDGEPVTASTGSMVDLTQIPATHVERIEVVKGATSALYGSSAIGGVINIITETPETGLHYQWRTDLGTWGDANANESPWYPGRVRFDGGLSYGTETFSLAAAVNGKVLDGFMSGKDNWDQPGPDGAKLDTLLTGTWYATEQSWHQLSYENYYQKLHMRYTDKKAGKTAFQEKKDDAHRHTLKYKSFWQMDTRDIQLSAVNETYSNDSMPNLNLLRQAEFTYSKVALQVNQTLGDLQTLTMGLDIARHGLNQSVQESGANRTEIDDKSMMSYEAYFQDHIDIGRWSLLPGLRWQYDRGFGKAVTPKINLRYDLLSTDTHEVFIRAGVGRGYRVPNLKERWYKLDHSEVGDGYQVLGNPDLEPEKSISYQLGLGIVASTDYQLDLNLFQNDLSNLIDTLYKGNDPAGHAIYQYSNVEKARTQGFEVNGLYRFTPGNSLQIGYSYLDAKDLILDRRLMNRPRHQAKIQLDVSPFDDWNFIVNSAWQSFEVEYETLDGASGASGVKKTSPGWAQVDIKLNYEVFSGFSLYGGVDNLTDVRRNFLVSYDNRPIEGRMIYFGIEFKR